MKIKLILALFSFFVGSSCFERKQEVKYPSNADTIKPMFSGAKTDSSIQIRDTIPHLIDINKVPIDSIIGFAKTLLGIRYRYASSDPAVGFDCSGFITYVFNHFNIQVPRSSKDFEYSGVTIPLTEVKKGDLILFTGTDSTETFIGHIGIIVSDQNDPIEFIHSTSGKAYGVVITQFNKYYLGRYIKTIRLFQ